QFSSDEATLIFNCVIPQLDQPSTVLLAALPVTLQGTILSPQVMREAQYITGATNYDLSQRFRDSYQDDQVVILLQLQFSDEIDLYGSSELSPEIYPGQLFSLSDFEFVPQFNDEGEKPLFIPQLLPDEIDAGTIYPFYFSLNDVTWSDLQYDEDILAQQYINFDIDLSMFPPFRFETCETGNVQTFSLQFYVAPGDSRQMPENYGDPVLTLSGDSLAEIRHQLLSLAYIMPESPEIPIESETTTEVTPELAPEQTPEVTSEATSEVTPDTTP
ncbi:MAG: hypothetical protein ACPG7F_22065, partial [Aggregatilineales bacterium]